MIEAVVIIYQTYSLYILYYCFLYINVSCSQLNLDARSSNDQPVINPFSKIVQRWISSIYWQCTTQRHNAATAEPQGNEQSQRLIRRGVRLQSGRAGRQNRKRQKRPRSEAPSGNVLSHGLTWAEAGRRVRPNVIWRLRPQAFKHFRENRYSMKSNKVHCTLNTAYCNAKMLHSTVFHFHFKV